MAPWKFKKMSNDNVDEGDNDVNDNDDEIGDDDEEDDDKDYNSLVWVPHNARAEDMPASQPRLYNIFLHDRPRTGLVRRPEDEQVRRQVRALQCLACEPLDSFVLRALPCAPRQSSSPQASSSPGSQAKKRPSSEVGGGSFAAISGDNFGEL